MESGKIRSIRAGGGETNPRARVVDGTGRYLVPGYLDMHVHSMVQKNPRENSAVLLAYGVTGIRQMAGTPELLRRRQLGEHLGGPFEMTLIQCSKMSWMIRAMMVVKPPQPMKLSEADMTSLTGQLIIANPILFRLKMEPKSLQQSKKLMGSFSEDKCKKLAAVFAKNQTWQCPTLIRSETMRFADDPRFTRSLETRYLPAELRAVYTEFSQQYKELLKPADRDILQRHKELALHVLRIFNDAGVPLMAGSDYGGGWVIPGVSLHQEFDLLEQAGISPLRVLQMTTLDAARFLNREASLGTVEEGNDANLVLLDGDPTASVQNLHKIHAVIRGGHFYGIDELAEMRETIATRYATA